MNKMWKTTELKLLANLVELGYTHREIGQKLDRSRETVASKCTQLKIKSKCGSINNRQPGITYLVYFPKLNVYKIGATSKTTEQRNNIQKLQYEIILEHKFSTGIEAMQLEKEWLENVKEFKVNTGLLNCGNTETFRL